MTIISAQCFLLGVKACYLSKWLVRIFSNIDIEDHAITVEEKMSQNQIVNKQMKRE